MSNFSQQTKNIYQFLSNKNSRNEYNDEMVKKTWHYQKKFGFETSPRQGHEFWNNEADAFKHTFAGAESYLKYGSALSQIGGIVHEMETPHNPRGEWNMDSWNNNQGREVAKEIQKEYGDNFMKLSPQKRDDIIAVKVMDRMRNGQLITNPNDERKYTGVTENIVNSIKRIQESNLPFTPTRGVGGVNNNGIPLGFATPANLHTEQNQSSFFGYTNPLTGSNRIYTREDVGSMSRKEFDSHEKEIMEQVKSMGGTMPTNGDLRQEAMTGGGVVYVNSYTRTDGTRVKGYYRSVVNYASH